MIGRSHLLAYAGSIFLVGTSFLPYAFLHAKRTLTTEDLQLQFSLDRMLDAVFRQDVANAGRRLSKAVRACSQTGQSGLGRLERFRPPAGVTQLRSFWEDLRRSQFALEPSHR